MRLEAASPTVCIDRPLHIDARRVDVNHAMIRTIDHVVDRETWALWVHSLELVPEIAEISLNLTVDQLLLQTVVLPKLGIQT